MCPAGAKSNTTVSNSHTSDPPQAAVTLGASEGCGHPTRGAGGLGKLSLCVARPAQPSPSSMTQDSSQLDSGLQPCAGASRAWDGVAGGQPLLGLKLLPEQWSLGSGTGALAWWLQTGCGQGTEHRVVPRECLEDDRVSAMEEEEALVHGIPSGGSRLSDLQPQA